MFRYSCYGLTIHSVLELPELPPGGEQPDVVIRLGSVPRTSGKATMDEEIAFHARGGAFHMKHGREIIMDPPPGVDPDLLRVLLVGRMMGFLLRQRGWLALHASSVEIGGEAVLFLGASGSGKSTTAAAFHSRGHQVLTDDVSALRLDGGQCWLQTAGPRIRLLGDSRAVFGGAEPAGKFQWHKHLFDLKCGEQADRVPVRRIYLLEYGDTICCEYIPNISAVALMSAHSFVKHWRMNKVALVGHLRDCSAAARTVLVHRLFRRRSLGALPELVRWVEIDIAAGRR